ncbi:hypothetical protein ACFX2I_028029 [Malus domestica]
MATVNISTHNFEAGASILHPRNLHAFELHQAPQLRRQKPLLLLFCTSNQSFPLLIRLFCFPIHSSCSSDTASPLSGWTRLLRYKRSRRRRGIVVGAVVVVGVEREWEGRRRS